MPDDQEFLARLRRHEEAAFAELFERYADRVYRLAMGLLKQADDAEEIVQATFVSAFEALDRFEPRAQYQVALPASRRERLYTRLRAAFLARD